MTEAAKENLDGGYTEEEIQSKKIVDAFDEKLEAEHKALAEEFAKTSGFSKLMPYNKPVHFIPMAILASMISGSAVPIFGVYFGRMLTLLSTPKYYYE